MKVIMHYPDSKHGQQLLEKKIAEVHARAVIDYINKLICPQQKKEELLYSVIQEFQ